MSELWHKIVFLMQETISRKKKLIEWIRFQGLFKCQERHNSLLAQYHPIRFRKMSAVNELSANSMNIVWFTPFPTVCVWSWTKNVEKYFNITVLEVVLVLVLVIVLVVMMVVKVTVIVEFRFKAFDTPCPLFFSFHLSVQMKQIWYKL